MAFHPREHLTTGELINGAIAELRGNLRPVLIYLGLVLALGATAEFGPPLIDDLASLAGVAAYFGGQYVLFEIMLRKAGHLPAARSRRFLRFGGLGVLVFFGVTLASSLLLFPGIILAARWIMAPSILVATPRGVFASLGESWSLSHGSTRPISLALAALVLMAFAAATALDGLIPASGGGEALVGSLLYNCGNLLLLGLSVAVYRRLDDQSEALAAVFA